MTTRREFIRKSGAIALSAIAVSGNANAWLIKKMPPVGVQLFTFFKTIDNDVRGTLQQIASIGYKEIESAFSMKGGYYGMTAADFSSMLKDLGLTWKSHHVLGAPFKMPDGKTFGTADGKPMRTLQDSYQELVDEVAAAGVPYLVCANTPIGTSDELKNSLETLAKAAQSAKKAGITLAYHNHDKEFETMDGKVIYDRFLEETPKDLMMELDLCWVTKAKVDPVNLFINHPGRFPLWHVKDIDKDFTGPQEVGTGVVDFKRIFANSKKAGLKHFFVEHDGPADPVKSITTSFQNLKKILA